MIYDIEGLANELEVGLDSIIGLYSSYIEEMKQEIEEMKLCLEKLDWVMLQRVVHNIKGVSVNLSIMDVFAEAEKFDILLKKDDISDSEEYVNAITNLITDAEMEIKEFFSNKGFAF